MTHLARPLLAGVTFALLAVPGWPTVASADDWVEVTSPHFRVITDQGGRHARRVALDLERIHALYGQVLPEAVSEPYHRVLAVVLEDVGELLDWLPRYEDRERPGGLFASLPSGHYFLIRLDGAGRDTVYHEYLHLLTRLNVGRLPPWLSEGLADFYAQADFVGSTAKFGRIDQSAIRYLNSRSLIPLEELVGRETNPHEDGSYVDVRVFYAQAWALTHYLMLGNEALSASGVVSRYMDRMERGDDPVEAFVELVGPLDEVREELRRYLRNLLFRMFEVDLDEEIDDDDFLERDLPEAHALAERAMVLAGFGAVDRAADALAEARDLAPEAPPVLTAAGFIELARDDPDAADAAFSAAVVAGAGSYLPYYTGATRRRPGGAPQSVSTEERIRRLERAVALNPRLVPAYHELAELLAREDRAAESFELARRAVEVDVRESYSWVLLGRAALRLNEIDAARLAGERGLEVAGDERGRAMLQSFLGEVDRHAAWLAVEEGRRRDRLIREARATGPPPPVRLARVDEAPSAEPRPVDPAPDGLASPGRQLSLAGSWVELRCAGPRAVDVVVRSERPPTTLVLRAPGARAVEIVDPDTLTVQERIECGPVDRQVEVDFTVRRIADGMVYGDLTELRFP